MYCLRFIYKEDSFINRIDYINPQTNSGYSIMALRIPGFLSTSVYYKVNDFNRVDTSTVLTKEEFWSCVK